MGTSGTGGNRGIARLQPSGLAVDTEEIVLFLNFGGGSRLSFTPGLGGSGGGSLESENSGTEIEVAPAHS